MGHNGGWMDSSQIPNLDPHAVELVTVLRAVLAYPGDLDEGLVQIQSQMAAAGPPPDGDIRKQLLRRGVLTAHAINRKRRPKGAAPEPEGDLFEELRLEDSYRHLLRNSEQLMPGLGLPLRTGLLGLGELDRAVFVLRSICDLKYQEIAEMIDIPVGTVMGSLVRSRVRLRRSLAEQIHEV